MLISPFRLLGRLASSLLVSTVLGLSAAGQIQQSTAPKAMEAGTNYQQLDRYARQLPDKQATTVAQLARSLNAAAHTDEEKARLIFSWLAYHIEYDTDYLRGDHSRDYSPAEVLRQRRSICQGYADLFTELAQLMKLTARTVTGYARTSANDGAPTSNHAWNMYRAGGSWHMADATWGAGSMASSYRFVPAFTDLWFDTPPAAFVFSHVPDESTKQLLEVPVTREQVHQWPYVSTELFRRGVSGAALLRALGRSLQPGPAALPMAYAAPFEAQIEQVPLRAELEPHRAVVFRFSVPENTEVAIDNGGRTQVLQASGAFREATFRPVPGPLTVLLWARKGSSLRYTLLQYEVAPVLPLRELRRRFPDPNNVAYLVRRRAQWTALVVAPAN